MLAKRITGQLTFFNKLLTHREVKWDSYGSTALESFIYTHLSTLSTSVDRPQVLFSKSSCDQSGNRTQSTRLVRRANTLYFFENLADREHQLDLIVVWGASNLAPPWVRPLCVNTFLQEGWAINLYFTERSVTFLLSIMALMLCFLAIQSQSILLFERLSVNFHLSCILQTPGSANLENERCCAVYNTSSHRLISVEGPPSDKYVTLKQRWSLRQRNNTMQQFDSPRNHHTCTK